MGRCGFKHRVTPEVGIPLLHLLIASSTTTATRKMFNLFASAKQIAQNIKKNEEQGTARQLAVRGKGTHGDPNFVYSYGNYRGYSNQPEVINFWPREPEAAVFANAGILAALEVNGIKPITPGEVRVFPRGLLGEDGELPVRARLLNSTERVRALDKYLCACDPRSPVLLVEFPDFDGKFIDEPGCDPEIVREIRSNSPFLVSIHNKRHKGFA